MAVIAAWGILLAWVRWQGGFYQARNVAAYSTIVLALCVIPAHAAGRFLSPDVRRGRTRTALSGIFAVFLLATIYLAWAYHRTMYLFVYGLDRPFPFPDPAINFPERWFDARNPVGPNMLKLHGEYMTVGWVLGMSVLAGISVCACCAGALSKGRFPSWGRENEMRGARPMADAGRQSHGGVGRSNG
jgi:hypothetical protein